MGGRTGSGVGVLDDADELVHLVVDEGEEGDVDREGDEREQGGEEGDERGEERHSDVRGEREQEGDEGDARGCARRRKLQMFNVPRSTVEKAQHRQQCEAKR